MKTKLHIDINTYEFLEFDIEYSNFNELDAQVKELHNHYHKFISGEKLAKVEKIEKHKIDFIEDLPIPDEPIILND